MNIAIPESIKVWSQFIHPVLMWVLLATTVYALYLGLKIRQIRSAEGETKKKLIKGRYNIRHYEIGSILLAFITIGAFLAMAVTYLNNGKIFFGSHLVIGLIIVSLVVTSASLSPLMQRGSMWARNVHFALNIGVLGLFSWQAITGVRVIQNIISKM